MMDKDSARFGSLADLLGWCRLAPPGTSLDAGGLASVLTDLAGDVRLREDVNDGSPEPESWRSKLWTVPADTRLGVAELAEALGRPRSFVYAHTSAKAEDRLPHRRLDGILVFRAG